MASCEVLDSEHYTEEDERTIAKLLALCIFCMVPNLIIYRQHHKTLMMAQINEKSADVRMMGLAAASNWSIVRIALSQRQVQVVTDGKAGGILTITIGQI